MVGVTQIGGIDNPWIDDQRPARIIGSDPKSRGLRALQHIAASDFPPPILQVLVDLGPVLADRPDGRVQYEIALRIYLQPIGSLEAECDLRGVRAGGYDEVILQFTVVAVVDQIN